MSRRKPEHGYALTLMLVLLVSGSLYVIVSRLDSTTLQTARTAETARALQQAKSALLAYALTYRESHPHEATAIKVAGYGYLPCPDLGGDDGIGMYGTAAGNCGNNNAISIGLLPYRSLGLPDLRDGDGNCLWYAVSGTHKNNPNTNPLNWDTRGQIEVFDADGVLLLGAAGSGAAAVVISPGAPVDGPAVQQSGLRAHKDKPCGTDSTQAAAYLESLAAQMHNGIRKAADGSTVGNDKLAWLSAIELYAAVGKRGTEFPGYINTALTDLAGVLNRNYAGNNPASGYRLASPLVINDIVSTEPTKQSAQNFARQWSDHLWFRKCSVGCTVLGASCAGVLIWSGSGASMPRTSADYLESASQSLISSGTGNLVAADVGASYAPETPHKDVALCLNPT
jgi:type II secretory pathway pseudopilin PulG